MNPLARITDREVADLPLTLGRAELLEEIVRTPVAVRRTRRPWTVAVAAAAAVVTVVAVPLWFGRGGDGARVVDVAPGSTSAGAAPAAPTGHRAVLTAPGWRIDTVGEDEWGGGIQYERDGQRLDISWVPASLHDGRYADRDDIGGGVAVQLLGEPATRWAYSGDDHTVIGPVTNDHFFEVRGSGMDLASFTDVMGGLARVDEEGFAAAVFPAGIISPAQVSTEIEEILADVPVPDGFDMSRIEMEGFNARYHIISAATGAVTCAWVTEYAAGRRAAAADAMAGSRGWDALVEIADEGDWPEAGVWSVADEMAADTPGELLRERSGC